MRLNETDPTLGGVDGDKSPYLRSPASAGRGPRAGDEHGASVRGHRREDGQGLRVRRGGGADRVREHVRGGRQAGARRVHEAGVQAVQPRHPVRPALGRGPVPVAARAPGVQRRPLHRRVRGLRRVHPGRGCAVRGGDPRRDGREGHRRVLDGRAVRAVRAACDGPVLQVRLRVRVGVVPRVPGVRGVHPVHEEAGRGVPVPRGP